MKARIHSTLYALIVLVLCCAAASAANIGNAVYGLYSETYEGLLFDVENSTDNVAGSSVDGAYLGAWGVAGLSDEYSGVPEGNKALKAVVNGNGGLWMQFGSNRDGNPANARIPTNMSGYAGGTIDFTVKTSIDIIVKLEWKNTDGSDGAAERRLSSLGVALDGQWHRVSVPLSSFTGINLAKITVPAGFHTVWDTTSGTYWIDNVIWRKPAAGALAVTVKNVSNNAVASSLTWSGITLNGSAGWKAADQYIELKLTDYTPNWGVQVYTDNKASNASPRYTGSGNPAGLLHTTMPDRTLPTCWRVVDVSTTTLTVREGVDQQNGTPYLYSSELGPDYRCWFYMKDKSTTGFVNSDDYVTVWDERGVHHASSQTAWQGAVSPNYLYIGANFAGALTPAEYRTSKLTVELYYE